MKLKHIALAVAMVAAGGANAAQIDNGASGNGGLFFTIWDAASSYTLNLKTNITTFEAGIAAAGTFDMAWADSTLSNWLSTASTSTLKWNVVAVDRNGPQRLLTTYQTLPTFPKDDGVMRSVNGSVGTFAINVNTKLAVADSAVYGAGTTGYAGVASFGENPNGFLGFSNAGTFANNGYLTGMKFERIDSKAALTAKSTYTQYKDDGKDIRVWIDGTQTLHIAAVPEPETYAMLLAGLGLIGTIARRKSKSKSV